MFCILTMEWHTMRLSNLHLHRNMTLTHALLGKGSQTQQHGIVYRPLKIEVLTWAKINYTFTS